MKNDGFPDFSSISVDKCLRRIGSQSTKLEETVTKAEDFVKAANDAGKRLKPSEFFEKVLQPIEAADKELVATWGLSRTLYHGNDILFPARNYFSMHQRARRANMARFHSQPIHEQVLQLKKLYDSDNNATDELTDEQKRVLDVYASKSKACGLHLNAEEGGELEYRLRQLTKEQITYESKVHVAIEHFYHTITDYGLIQSFPSDFLQAIAVDSKNPLNGPWKVELKPYVVENFLTYCPDRNLRYNVWKTDTQKASRQVRTELDNGIHVESIRDHRDRVRELLGYKSHVELKRKTFHLDNTEQPESILSQLKPFAKPEQTREIDLLSDFAVQNGFGAPQLDEYDVAYWNRKYNVAVNKFDENLIQEYFPVEKVFSALFKLSEHLFNAKIVERSDESIVGWNRSVKYFDVFDTRNDASSEPIGGFFLDAFSTSHEHIRYERPHGYVVPIQEHSKIFNSKPLQSLVYNFAAPLYGKPHTLKLKEVEVVFAKFANLLQKLLNETNYRDLSGLTNVEYVNDVVCSDVLSNLVYNSNVLKEISEHISTKEPLNDDHIRAIQTQRRTLAGHNLSKKLFKSSLDLELFTTQNFWLECLRKNYGKYMYFELDKRDARLCSMMDVVVGNWSGCYHGLIYSQMLAAEITKDFDVALESNAVTNVGEQFRQTYLSLGSNSNPLDTFKSFCGREPTVDAYVSHLGLKRATAQ